jgi:hypothetical protein
VHPDVKQAADDEAKKRALAQCPLTVQIDDRHVSVCSGSRKLVSWSGTDKWDFLAILGHHMFYAAAGRRDLLLQYVQINAGKQDVYQKQEETQVDCELTWRHEAFVLEDHAPTVPSTSTTPPLLLAGLYNVEKALREAFGGDITKQNNLVQLITGRLQGGHQ